MYANFFMKRTVHWQQYEYGSHQNTEYKIHLKIIFLDEHDTHLGRKKNMGSEVLSVSYVVMI